ncbi:hypothetical protein AB0H00_20660 [Nocardia sp. NPDC023852]|uniref:hypothetical protein n=1 Tax=Nocardia sp. NPDC023852 TaxID=3154697 RepID=UPI0033E15EBA
MTRRRAYGASPREATRMITDESRLRPLLDTAAPHERIDTARDRIAVLDAAVS